MEILLTNPPKLEVQSEVIGSTVNIKLVKKPRAPRIGFEITEDQRKALKRFAPHGNVTALYQAITEDLIELFEKHGSAKVLAALISRQVKIYEISKTLFDAGKNDSSRTQNSVSQPL